MTFFFFVWSGHCTQVCGPTLWHLKRRHARQPEKLQPGSAAWWSAYSSSEHRMLHWLQLVSLANTPVSASSVHSQKLARLEREVAELRKDRSRTPKFLGPLSRSLAARVAEAQKALEKGEGGEGRGARRSSTKPRRGSSKIFSTAHGKSHVSTWTTIPSVSISRKACVRRVPSAKESIAASVVVVPNRTMSAIASNRRSRTCPESILKAH